MQTPNSDLPMATNAISVKIPPFWETSPELWFANIEAQFSVSGITADQTKYYYVVSALNSETLSYVSDIVLTPPNEDKYATLKQRLVTEFSDSEHKRIKALLSELVLGDDKPSHLLRKMRTLGGTTVGDDILKTLWLQRLPQSAQAILSVSEGALDKLSVLADKIIEVTPLNTNKVYEVKTETDNEISQLKEQIASLSTKIDRLSRARDRTPNFRNNRKFFSKSPKRNKTYDFCWYHFKFGDKANKCTPPCKFSSNSEN